MLFVPSRYPLTVTACPSVLRQTVDGNSFGLWYDAGRVRTCHSGYEPGDSHACLCRRNTLRFRTRSARRYTICCEKCSSRAVPTSAAADHFGPRGAVAQRKHSLATRSSCCVGFGFPRTRPGTDHGLTQLALDLLSWLSICSRFLSVAWGSVGVGFDVRCKAPSQPGSTRSVHDA